MNTSCFGDQHCRNYSRSSLLGDGLVVDNALATNDVLCEIHRAGVWHFAVTERE